MTSAAVVKKVHRGTWYKTNGEVVLVRPANGKSFTNEELNRAVGGYIESVRPAKDGVDYRTGRIVPGVKPGPEAAKVCQVWVNEEGLLKQLPRNPFTVIVADMNIYRLNGYPPNWRLSGDVLVIYNVPADKLALTEAVRVTL